jgi:two-component system response regulator FlrC
MSYFDFDAVQSKDKKVQDVLQLSQQMAATQASVLIVGEAGVGKSGLARHIHQKSKRSRLQVIECKNTQALPPDLQNGSTLILEDIDTASLALQAELSQFLELMNPQRPRIISTSRRDLRQLVKQEHFRHDLFYKLAVIHLELPRLEERKSDLIAVCDFILDVNQIMHGKQGLRLSAEAFGRLSAWKWPGNIRELENVLERAVILAKGPQIEASQIIFESLANEQVSDFAPGMSLSEVEKRLILQTLELTAQNRTRAAQMLGISIRTLRNKLNEYKEEGFA